MPLLTVFSVVLFGTWSSQAPVELSARQTPIEFSMGGKCPSRSFISSMVAFGGGLPKRWSTALMLPMGAIPPGLSRDLWSKSKVSTQSLTVSRKGNYLPLVPLVGSNVPVCWPVVIMRAVWRYPGIAPASRVTGVPGDPPTPAGDRRSPVVSV